MPPSDSPWVPLWPYALAVGSSCKRLQTALMASGVPVMVIAGEPQVRRNDVEGFMLARQREAEARAHLHVAATEAKRTSGSTSLQQRLDSQALEIHRLKLQLDALMNGNVQRDMTMGAANER
jgi:hypothetical protein